MNYPRLFFLDFDATLFSTELFWDDVRKKCAEQLSIPKAFFLETYAKAKSLETVYDIDIHLKLLGISREQIISVFVSIFDQKSYMFEDVMPFMNNHSDDTLVIVTQGVDWFQKIKIASLPIKDHIFRVIVTNYKKRLYIENTVDFTDGVEWEGNHYKSLTFVDNMADAFLSENHDGTLLQYRVRRWGADSHAEEPTLEVSTEITTLLDIT